MPAHGRRRALRVSLAVGLASRFAFAAPKRRPGRQRHRPPQLPPRISGLALQRAKCAYPLRSFQRWRRRRAIAPGCLLGCGAGRIGGSPRCASQGLPRNELSRARTCRPVERCQVCFGHWRRDARQPRSLGYLRPARRQLGNRWAIDKAHKRGSVRQDGGMVSHDFDVEAEGCGQAGMRHHSQVVEIPRLQLPGVFIAPFAMRKRDGLRQILQNNAHIACAIKVGNQQRKGGCCLAAANRHVQDDLVAVIRQGARKGRGRALGGAGHLTHRKQGKVGNTTNANTGQEAEHERGAQPPWRAPHRRSGRRQARLGVQLGQALHETIGPPSPHGLGPRGFPMAFLR